MAVVLRRVYIGRRLLTANSWVRRLVPAAYRWPPSTVLAQFKKVVFGRRREKEVEASSAARPTDMQVDDGMLQNVDTEPTMTVAHVRQGGSLLRSVAAVIAPRRTAPAPTRSARPIIDLISPTRPT